MDPVVVIIHKIDVPKLNKTETLAEGNLESGEREEKYGTGRVDSIRTRDIMKRKGKERKWKEKNKRAKTVPIKPINERCPGPAVWLRVNTPCKGRYAFFHVVKPANLNTSQGVKNTTIEGITKCATCE